MPLTFQYVYLLIVAGALLVPGRVARVGLVGLVPLGLAVAASAVRLGDGLSGLALRAAEQGTPLSFLQINTGLLFLGIALVVIAVATGIARAPGELRVWLAALLVGGGVGPMIAAQLPLAPYIGWLAPFGAAAAIGATAVTLFIVGTLLRLGARMAWLNQRLLQRTTRLPAVYWAPLFMPFGVICVWHVAGSARNPGPRTWRMVEMLVGLALIGILAGGTGIAGAFLLLCGIPLALRAMFILSTTWGRLLWLPLAWGTLMVLIGGLASQVTYTTLAAGGIAVAVWVYHTPE